MNSTSHCPFPVRLVYVANIRIPSEKAHVLQIFKNCEAFARRGICVELLYPRRRTSKGMENVTDPFDYYQVERNFALKEIPCPDLISVGLPGILGPLAFIAQTVMFTRLALRQIPIKLPGILYTRDIIVATILSLCARPYLLELHTLPRIGVQKAWKGLLARHTIGIVVISQHLAEDCVRAGVPRECLLVAPDAVDPRLLERIPDRTKARGRLDFPLERPLAVYTGHLYPWKGVDTIIDCSRDMPELLFVIVGGLRDDIDRFARKVRLAGHYQRSS